MRSHFYNMNELRNGVPAPKDAEEKKEENPLDKILDSNACRKLFTWAMPSSSDEDLKAVDEQLKEEQRLRWNFDFETETPLPGRYQWVRTDYSNGHAKDDSPRSRLRNGEVKSRSSPYSRKSRTSQTDEQSSRSTRSCDRSLNGPRRSERNSQVQLNESPTV